MPDSYLRKAMDNFDISVEGAPVIFSNMQPDPYNPLNRPEISYRKPVIAASIWIISSAALLWSGSVWFPKAVIWVFLGFSAIFFALIAKRALIWSVHLYQNKASDETRLRCVFEPSCSEYMLMAVDKYGLIRGVIKGIRRLHRCHPPNGGKDYP